MPNGPLARYCACPRDLARLSCTGSMWGQGMSQLHQWQEQGPLQHKLQQLLHTLQQKYPEVQRLAVSMNRRLKPIAPDVAARTAAQMMAEDPASARAHLDSVRRRLMRDEPEFSQ